MIFSRAPLNRRIIHGEKSMAKGFSVLELLVAVTIVAVLAAFIVSAIQSAKRVAMRAEGVSVMRSIGQAMFLYSDEHGGSLPGSLYWRQAIVYRAPNGNLIPKLAPYMGGPSSQTDLPFPPAFAKIWARWVSIKSSISIYEVNPTKDINGSQLGIWGDANVDVQGKKPGSIPLQRVAIRLPSQTWALQDIVLKDIPSGPDALVTEKGTIWGEQQYQLYFDGHVGNNLLKIQ